MENIKNLMTDRMLGIALMVDNGASVIDVGCDHGYIPIYLVKAGISKKALAADVNDGPLKAAEKNISKYNLSEKIKTKKSDGLRDIDATDYDTVIVAGMGGVLISEILSAGIRGKTYILQPMTAIDYLMDYLAKNKFKILEHKIVEEENHIYNILKVCDGEFEPSELEKFLGALIPKNELYFKYAEKLRQKFSKVIIGLTKSQNCDGEKLRKYRKLLEELEENMNKMQGKI